MTAPGDTTLGRTAAPAAPPRPATSSRTAPAPTFVDLPAPARLSEGLERLGEYQGSGFTERRYLVRRGDGQVIQLSRLLYLVVSSIDGVRDAETISHRVSGRYGAEVTTDDISYLIERKLAPLGITASAGDDPRQPTTPVPRTDLLLALRGHKVIFRETHVARIAAALAWLHHPAVVVCTLAGIAALDVWLFALHGAMTPVLQVLQQPLWMLLLFALTLASLLFHEFGHASACRYSGAVPGKIGCGIFLIWPSMYTDVTDVYRIGRAGRLRTGLGGVYFNGIFMLALAAGYLATGQPFFLAAVYLAHFEILEQLMPAVRLDGYYILGDLAGVPDLYGKVKPILLSLLPGRARAAADVADLKRSARVVVTTWVVTMIPLLFAEAAYALWNLPRLLVTAARSLRDQCAGTYGAFADGHPAAGLVAVIGTLMLLCPMAGGVYLAGRLTGRLWCAAVRAGRGRPGVRLALAGAAAAGLAVLGTAWVQGLTPRPLPEAAPVTPALQPGHPTPRPPHLTPTPTSSATDGNADPTPTSSAPGPADATAVRHSPTATSPPAPPSASASATSSPAPSTAGPTHPVATPPGATPTPRPSVSRTPPAGPGPSASSSAPPSATASPSPTPSASPSTSAS